MDHIDRKILELLQRDSSRSIAEIAEQVNLSRAPCWRRIQALERDGVIRRQVALLDAKHLNVATTVFVMLRTNQHNEAWFRKFSAAMERIPEVVEFYRMSGDVDYLIRLVVPDINAYDQVYKKLIRTEGLTDVSASFALEQIKSTTELPLDYMVLERGT